MHRQRRRARRDVNHSQSAMVMNGMLLLLALCGWVIGGEHGAHWAVAGGALPLPVPPTITPEEMLRQFGARLIRRQDMPALFDILADLCRRAGLPKLPDLYCLPDSQHMNAYALGSPDHSAITLTEGLLRGMTLDEITAILAHEVAHIRNDDTSAMAGASSMVDVAGVAVGRDGAQSG